LIVLITFVPPFKKANRLNFASLCEQSVVRDWLSSSLVPPEEVNQFDGLVLSVNLLSEKLQSSIQTKLTF